MTKKGVHCVKGEGGGGVRSGIVLVSPFRQA